MHDLDHWESCENTKQPSDRDARERPVSRKMKDDEKNIPKALSVLTVDDNNVLQGINGAQFESEESIAANDAYGSTKGSIGLKVDTSQTRDDLPLLFDSFCVSTSWTMLVTCWLRQQIQVDLSMGEAHRMASRCCSLS